MSTDVDRIGLATVDLTNITDEIHDISPRPVAYGGYSDVYKATWRGAQGEIQVAVKVIRISTSPEGDIPPVLRREICVWKKLDHPNIQFLCGFYEGYGRAPALVSPWYENGDIISYLRAHARDRDVSLLKLRLLCEVLRGVDYLHLNLIVHGDIKGGNVLISDYGVARLCDFGLSRLLEDSRSITHSGVRGTSRWMAPELLLDEGGQLLLSYASDIWACGCLFVEVWSGVPPYNKKNEAQIILGLSQRKGPDRPSDMPEFLWRLVMACCNFDATSRPQAGQVGPLLQHTREEQVHCFGPRPETPSYPDNPTASIAAIREVLNDLRSLDISNSVHYVDTERIAGGGSADIHAGILMDSRTEVVLKIARKSDRELTLRTAEKWKQEIIIWRRLSHPNVLPLLGLCWHFQPTGATLLLPATVSPLCPFGDVNHYLKIRSTTTERKVELAKDILMGLEYLHDHQIVHGDMKGGNILISADETAHIADFGMSAFKDEHLVATPTVVQSARWMAPELFDEHARVTVLSDMWAVGCVFYEIITGKPPYHTMKTEPQVMLYIVNGNHPLRPDGFPDKIWGLSIQCWNPVPEYRPSPRLLLQQVWDLVKYSELELQRETREPYDVVGQPRTTKTMTFD